MKMKIRNIALIFIGLLAFSMAVTAQTDLNRIVREKKEKDQQDRAALDNSLRASNSAKALHQRLSNASGEEFTRAVADAAAANDKSVVPYLKARLALWSEGKNAIEVALIRLGEREYFDSTVAELSSKDAAIRSYAVGKLSVLKTKEAYAKLYELLDNDEALDEIPGDDELIPSMSQLVKYRLADTEADTPKGKDAYDTAAWKAWFVRKHLID